MTLIEVVTTLAISGIVIGSLYLLVGAAVKGYQLTYGRIESQQEGSKAITWIADRVREALYDPEAACPAGLLLAGDGNEFAHRLAFRAIADENRVGRGRTYVYYREGSTLWEETFDQQSARQCAEEIGRALPDPGRRPLTPSIVKTFSLAYLDQRGALTADPDLVRLIQITLVVDTSAPPGHSQPEAYETVVHIRGP